MTAIAASVISATGTVAAVVVAFWLNQRKTSQNFTRVTNEQTQLLVKKFGEATSSPGDRGPDPDRYA
jgi:hypothetical protein